MLFNKVLDVLEGHKLHFKILNWQIGLTVEERSQVSLEVAYQGEEYEKCGVLIKKICEELKSEYYEN